MLANNVPISIFVKPKSIIVQEVKLGSSKSKVTDLVALRHCPDADPRTTLIILSEDGSLKTYSANSSLTDFWLGHSSVSLPVLGEGTDHPFQAKKKQLKMSRRVSRPASFPVDFVESSTLLNDVDFGGNDLLQVYNVQLLKQRLNTHATYVACSKPGGFTLEVVNKDRNMFISGFRVAVGGLDTHKNPTYIEVFGRSIPINTSRIRWYDVPLSREESLQADKKLSITFGPSTDQSLITIIDTVKVYGKNKEEFGWADDAEEFSAAPRTTASGTSVPVSQAAIASSSVTAPVRSEDSDGMPKSSQTIGNATVLESLFCSALDTLDGCFSIMPSNFQQYRREAMKIATKMINLQLSAPLQTCTRSLLSSLHDSKQSYYQQLDSAQLSGAMDSLKSLFETGLKDLSLMDCQVFHNILGTTRSVAVTRPHNLVKFTEKAIDSSEVEKVEAIVAPHDLKKIEPSEESLISENCQRSSSSDSTATSKTPPNVADVSLSDGANQNIFFLKQLMAVFWMLHKAKPLNPHLSPVYQPGLMHSEFTVQAIIEILHGFASSCASAIPIATHLSCSLLLAQDHLVSFSAKSALIRLLRPRCKKAKKVYLPSPPRCSTPGEVKAPLSPMSAATAAAAAAVEEHLRASAVPGGDHSEFMGALADVARNNADLAGAAAHAVAGGNFY